MPQLQINQGPQDALLYDNSRSYFTNVAYVRTSNFQMELRDVDPQSQAQFGSTLQFVIPKAADLLGPTDLIVELPTASDAIGAGKAYGWVESVGYAMIDKIIFSVGSHDIETITGDQLYIQNELMRADENRYGNNLVGKTGRPLVHAFGAKNSQDGKPTNAATADASGDNAAIVAGTLSFEAFNKDRLITAGTDTEGKKTVTIPLGLFFTKHPSTYFPLCAIAGCNDVRISIKLRSVKELLQVHSMPKTTSGADTLDVKTTAPDAVTVPTLAFASGDVRLRCHYVHVTGPEASTLMSKEHVRLMKLWSNTSKVVEFKADSDASKWKGQSVNIDLPFLHPVQELIFVVRKVSEMSESTDATAKPSELDQKGRSKTYFAFHGGGTDPNIDSIVNYWEGTYDNKADLAQHYLKFKNMKLTLNGQDRHPALASKGVDREYLMDRLLPMMHSNTTTYYGDVAKHDEGADWEAKHKRDMKQLKEMLDRKEIYVYPFALNPENVNPSGAVNFSKVSHAKLDLEFDVQGSSTDAVSYRIDVWGVHYNWLQIKDGRALTSFA